MTRDARAAFLARLPYTVDRFQLEAFDAIDAGRSVLVSAPTGSGKTLVADYAIGRTLAGRSKAFYTTPLKALSNQKYGELAGTYGEDRVGLLTGDTSRRADAPIVVMTTEVLRNMLLAGSELLAGLRVVVLDEVHYLQDPYRGGVWEEVIVLAPRDVSLVCLSATVANAPDLGGWLASVRGPTDVVVERRRPISLRHHFAITIPGADQPELRPLLDGKHPSSEAAAVDERVRRADRDRPPGVPARGRRSLAPFRTPRRTELAELLDDVDLLPAIVFIFSRAACDDAVGQCQRAGLRLTERGDRSRIRAIAEDHVEGITDDELGVLGYPDWLSGLESGVAAHHAGLVPAFRETVEECFAAGLLRVVFATETLSLGINMPARTVVLERFTKFGAAGRAPLTAGDYAQLTGRAGRRRLDQEGHAVALWSPEVPLVRMAQVAAGEPPPLRSSFRPTYNLAVNLVRRFDRADALAVLRKSFAQWQHDQAAASTGPPTRAGGRQPPGGYLADLLGRRLAVLEELGYVHGWSATEKGELLTRIYHEADLVVVELLRSGLLDTEPSVMAGILSSLVFEPRRSQRVVGRPEVRGRERRRKGGRRRDAREQLGERRRQDLQDRLAEVRTLTERVRALEEVHRVPPVRRSADGLGGAVAAWVRGASLATVLQVARADGVELAPGDFVRIVKQLGDLVGQIAAAVPGSPVAQTARGALPGLVRGVVAAGEGAFAASTTASTASS